MKKLFIIPIIVLLIFLPIIQAYTVVRPHNLLAETVVGEDGYLKIADSETTITGGFTCSNEVISRSGEFEFYNYGAMCESKYFVIHADAVTSPLNTITYTGSDVELNIGNSNGYSYKHTWIGIKQNIKDKYFRMTAKDNTANFDLAHIPSSDITISLVDDLYHPTKRYGIKGASGIDKVNLGLELIPSTLEPNIFVALVNGEKTDEIDLTGWDTVYIEVRTYNDPRTTASFTISNARFQYLFSCTKRDSEVLGAISYSGGETISLTADAKLPKVTQSVRFCSTHQPIITSSAGSREDNNEIYYALTTGKTLTIPVGEVWTLFGIFDVAGLPISCSADLYDWDTGICKDYTGFVTFLREGTLDTSTGVFITEPVVVTTTLTGEAGVYDTQNDSATYYNTDNIVCTDAGYVFSAAANGCVLDLTVASIRSETECTAQGANYVWYPDTSECILKTTCESGSEPVYDGGKLVSCVKSAETSLEVITPSELTDAKCQEQYGSNAVAVKNTAGDAYACKIEEVTTESVYYCGSKLMAKDDVCASDKPSDTDSIKLSVIDKSQLEQPSATKINYTYPIIIGILVLLGIGIFAIRKKRKKRRK